jgi:hypothetical protein
MSCSQHHISYLSNDLWYATAPTEGLATMKCMGAGRFLWWATNLRTTSRGVKNLCSRDWRRPL